MDPATVIGLVVAFGAVLGAIVVEGSSPMSVILPAPMLLVLGGTLGAGLMGSTVAEAAHAWRSVPKAFFFRPPRLAEGVAAIVALAERARREGLLALEEQARTVPDPFLRRGLQSAIDGTDPDDLRAILEERIATKRLQDRAAAKYFTDMGGYAPTVGIIGTVVSLVEVLENLAAPEELGELIGAAFVATLWGLLSANLVFLPLGTRLRKASDLECRVMELQVEGLLAVQAGANPRLVGERLDSLIPPTPAARGSAA